MSDEKAQVILQNQIEIMGALSLLLRYAKPDLIGKSGELDMQRDDLVQRHKATVNVLRGNQWIGKHPMAVSREPQHVSAENWYYEAKGHILVVHEVRDKAGLYIQTDQFKIPWRKIEASLKRVRAARPKKVRK